MAPINQKRFVLGTVALLAALFVSGELRAADQKEKPKEKPTEKCKKSDPGATVELVFEEKLNYTDGSDVLVPPLAMGKGVLVSAANGTLKIFDAKGEIAKRVDLGSSITVPPFEHDGKLVVLAGRKLVFLSPRDLRKINEVNLTEDFYVAGPIGDQSIALGSPTRIVVYATNGDLKNEFSGIMPNRKFPPFFYYGSNALIVGQNGTRLLKARGKKDDGGEDVKFKTQITGAAGNHDLVAVSEASRLHIFSLNSQKNASHELDGPIDMILPHGRGFLVSTATGKLLAYDSFNDKTPHVFDVRVTSKGLYIRDKTGIYVTSVEGDNYAVKGNTLSKTKLKGKRAGFFSAGRRGHVTFDSVILRLIDPDGNTKLEKRIENAKSFPIAQLNTDTFLFVGKEIRTLTLAENLKCPEPQPQPQKTK